MMMAFMGAFRTLVISLVISGGCVLWCQSNAENPLEEAKRLDQQGQFTKAIEEVLRIMNSRHLSDSQLSRAFVLLGYAYQEEGEFKQAQRAYERALPLLQKHQAPSDEYAEALESLADLYMKMGNAKAAVKLGRQALGIYERTSQHASVARACRNLAMWELSEGRRKDGSKFWHKRSKRQRIPGISTRISLPQFRPLRDGSKSLPDTLPQKLITINGPLTFG